MIVNLFDLEEKFTKKLPKAIEGMYRNAFKQIEKVIFVRRSAQE